MGGQSLAPATSVAFTSLLRDGWMTCVSRKFTVKCETRSRLCNPARSIQPSRARRTNRPGSCSTRVLCQQPRRRTTLYRSANLHSPERKGYITINLLARVVGFRKAIRRWTFQGRGRERCSAAPRQPSPSCAMSSTMTSPASLDCKEPPRVNCFHELIVDGIAMNRRRKHFRLLSRCY